MRIVALDLALRTGVADGEPGATPHLSFVEFGRENDDHADVFARVLRWIGRLLDPLNDKGLPDLIVTEAPVAKFDKSLQMGVRGVVLGVARNRGVKLIEVPVQTWRAYALGFGNLKGSVAKARCILMCQRLDWTVPTTKRGNPDHNAAEAAGMWLWAGGKVDPKNTVRHEPLFVGSRK